MSHFRDVVASMVKSLKEQYDQILSNTTNVHVTKPMIKLQVELDILTQYVNSQSIIDIDSQEQTAANGYSVFNDRDSKTPIGLEHQLKQEQSAASMVVNRPRDDIFPMVRLMNASICDELCDGDIKMYNAAMSKSLKIPRRNDDAVPPRKNRAKSLSLKFGHSLKRFACNKCPKKYRTKLGLTVHVSAKHPYGGNGPARFYCDQCTASYSFECSLRTHVKNKHENRPETATSGE